MTRYFSTFASGFEGLTKRFLTADLADAVNIEKLDGALIYETNAVPRDIRAVKYFKNSFIVLETFSNVRNIEEMASRAIVKNIKTPPLARTFRVVFSDANELVSIDGATKAKLIDEIHAQIKLSYRATTADIEFMMLRRDNGAGFFLQRITKNTTSPAAGELEPHIAIMLSRITNPSADDIFIDSFCGHGAIALARAQMASYRGIFAMDIDAKLTNELKSKIRGIKNSKIQKSFFVKTGDFLRNQFDDNVADAIATDPPWGMHQKIDTDFYARAMSEFARILKSGGRLVILTAREITLPTHPKLTPIETFDVLIHGKKATVHIYQAK
jgi:16S rRNA G966 N2-methylase RsmD